MGATKEYVVRLTVDGDKVIQTVVNLDDGLHKAGKQAKQTGHEISGAMREAKTGVVGIVNDLTGGLASKFMDVKDAIGGATAGMKGFKAALIGTGIGALVVALGAIVGYREELQDMFLDAAAGLEDFRIEYDRAIKASADIQTAWGLEERKLRALGVAESELLDLRRQNLVMVLNEQKAALESLEAQQKAIGQSQGEAVRKYGVMFGSLVNSVSGGQGKINELGETATAVKNQINELNVQIEEANAARNNALKAEADRAKAEADRARAEGLANAKTYHEKRLEQDVVAEKARIEAVSATTIETRQITGEIEIQVEKEIAMRKSDTVITVTEEQAKKEAAILEEAAQRRVDLQITTAQTLLSLVDQWAASDQGKSEKARKRNFAIQKAAAIAQATIDTYLGAQKAYTSQLLPGDPTSIARAQVAAGVAIASGLAKVAIIAKQKFEGGGGGSSGGGGGFGGGGGDGGFSGFQNIQPQAPTNQLINPQAQSQPVQAYVLAGNVSSETEARKKIADQARL